MCGWGKWRLFGDGDKATDGTRVSAVVIGSTRRRRGVWSVVIFAQRCGVVCGGVHVRLLKRWWEVVGPLIRQQIVLIQSLWRKTNKGVLDELRVANNYPSVSEMKHHWSHSLQTSCDLENFKNRIWECWKHTARSHTFRKHFSLTHVNSYPASALKVQGVISAPLACLSSSAPLVCLSKYCLDSRPMAWVCRSQNLIMKERLEPHLRTRIT